MFLLGGGLRFPHPLCVADEGSTSEAWSGYSTERERVLGVTFGPRYPFIHLQALSSWPVPTTNANARI
jgi:hypothetical protein